MSKKRQTKHRIAASEPDIKKRISVLRQAWKQGKDPVVLGQQIQYLTGDQGGCSYRGLAQQIKKPEATLRRYVHLASLPEEERKAYLQGETAKAVLARKAVRDQQERHRARLKLEKETGSVSDQIADLILEFFRFNGYFFSDVQPLLSVTRRLTRNRQAFPIPGKVPLDHRKLFEMARPPQWRGEPEFWVEHAGGWLAMILMTVAPEEDIRETAMNKAESRDGELIEVASVNVRRGSR